MRRKTLTAVIFLVFMEFICHTSGEITGDLFTNKTTKMSNNQLDSLETSLEMFIENVRQIRIIVSDFQPQGQNVLNQKM